MKGEIVGNLADSNSRNGVQASVINIVGDTPRMLELKELIKAVAPTVVPVMLIGKTGVGKDIVAQNIHHNSNRSGPFIAINCAAIPAELLESELFGYEKGAFTGADRARAGRFEMSSGGTLFLDEIGDMPLALQSKLLRTLENHVVQRIGGASETKLDLRFICATHKNIEKMVEEGQFRADLYYRLASFPIEVPSLSERIDDIPALLDVMIAAYLKRQPNAERPHLNTSALEELKNHCWPGNVRELRNVLERAFILFGGREVTDRHVRENLLRLRLPQLRDKEESDALWDAATFDVDNPHPLVGFESMPPPKPEDFRNWFQYHDEVDLRSFIRDLEVVMIEAALTAKEGLVSHAAEALKLRRTTLIEKMKKLMIERPSPD